MTEMAPSHTTVSSAVIAQQATAAFQPLDCGGSMERVQLNLGTESTVRALERGELPWTLHPACEFASDPGQWGASLINNGEVMIACLDAAQARSVVEIGAYAGDLTKFLLE